MVLCCSVGSRSFAGNQGGSIWYSGEARFGRLVGFADANVLLFLRCCCAQGIPRCGLMEVHGTAFSWWPSIVARRERDIVQSVCWPLSSSGSCCSGWSSLDVFESMAREMPRLKRQPPLLPWRPAEECSRMTAARQGQLREAAWALPTVAHRRRHSCTLGYCNNNGSCHRASVG